MSTQLVPVVKDPTTLTYARRGARRECWGATSVDGQWRFDRTEETGTPWAVTHRDADRPCEWATTLTNARHWVTHFGQQWLAAQQRAAA